MKRLELIRISKHPNLTAGVFLDSDTGLPLCFSLERPYIENMRSISAIPEGVYECSPFTSEKFKDVYEVKNVPNRSGILIHVANTVDELEGCIAPGLSVGTLEGEFAVLQSRLAMNVIRDLVSDNEFILNVRGC